MRSLVATELRTLRRLLQQAELRLASQMISGKVLPGSQDMENRTVRLELGKDSDGEPILSPPVRWQEPGAGRLKVHSAPADNEQMRLDSPSGTVGTASLAIFATYDDDNEPPSQDAEEAVLSFGETTIALRGGDALVKSPKVLVDSGDVHLGGEGGQKVARVGDPVDVTFGSSKGIHYIVDGSANVRAAG